LQEIFFTPYKFLAVMLKMHGIWFHWNMPLPAQVFSGHSNLQMKLHFTAASEVIQQKHKDGH
jgi:hypothetical protein